MMAGEPSDAVPGPVEHEDGEPTTMKAFWLMSDGRLVYVDSMLEDAKLREIRAWNTHVALSSWASELTRDNTVVRAKRAYKNLIDLCGAAGLVYGGDTFHNLYANYPLPSNRSPAITRGTGRFTEADVITGTITSGHDLMSHLQPLYAQYFELISSGSAPRNLLDRIDQLNAQWLVSEERSEITFAAEVKRSWILRAVVRFVLFLETVRVHH